MEPPEPIPNSEVKRSSADGSVGFPHVRVGHRQALILKIPNRFFLTKETVRDFFCLKESAGPSSESAHIASFSFLFSLFSFRSFSL